LTHPQQIAFGRRQHDPARLAAVPAHVMATEAPPPAELPRTGLVWTPSLIRNLTMPTCVVAALTNSARLWALDKGFDLPVVEAAVLRFFSVCAPCEDTLDAIGQTDGLIFLNALDQAASIGLDIGEQAPLVLRFKAIDTSDMAAIRDSIYVRKSALLGVTLHQADVQPGLDHWSGGIENAGPVAGEHAICGSRYTASGFAVATWGGEMPADDGWVMPRLIEAYAPEWTMQVAP
jgi:hypothetical protein